MDKNKCNDSQAHIVMQEHIDECIANLAKRRYSKDTQYSYLRRLCSFSAYLIEMGIERFQDVTLADLDAYRLHLVNANLSNATIIAYLRTAGILFKRLEERRLIFMDPSKDLQFPGYSKKLGYVPDKAEIKKLIMQPDIATPVGVRDRAMLEIAYGCGLRGKELAGLTVFDLDLKKSTLRVMGKGDKERIAPLGKQAVFWLRRYLKHARPKLARSLNEQGLWLGKDTGKKLQTPAVQDMVRRHVRASGLSASISTHSLRRAFATHMLSNGAHPVQIQILLGHANLKRLGHYLQVSITDMKKMHKRSKLGK